MKKLKMLSFAVCLMFGFTTVANGQAAFGVKAGVGLADVHLQSTILELFGANDLFSTNTVFHAGIVAELPIAEQFHVTGELLYAQKGFTAFDNIIGNQNAKVTGHYLSVPVMLFYEPIEGISVGGGAEVGYLLSAQTDILGAGMDLGTLWNNKVDVGLNVGAKADLTDNIWIEGRYNFGLTPLSDTQFNEIGGIPIGTNGRLTHRMASVSVGYRF